MKHNQRSIPARDGYELAATVYCPAGSGADIAVGIHSATAVPRGFYEPFAQHLAAQGMTVVTYDYRGIGESAPDSLRGFEATASDWVLQDMAGVLDWIHQELKPRRIGHVGHSFGGQTPGLLPNAELIDAMVTVVAQSGFWKLQRGWERWNVGYHTHLTLPLLSALMGYVPWSWFSKAEDLPRGVAEQWSSWCRSRNYLFDDPTLPLERYAAFTAPVLAYSVEDDHWGTVRAVDEVHAHYPNVTRRHLDPEKDRLPSIGHFGYFSRRNEPRWQEAVDWLLNA
jgi:predicted alpha/beta hydrolase